MPAAASMPVQQEIAETLREIDGHVRELARRTKRAKEVSGERQAIQACLDEIRESKATLQRYRGQVRKWFVELGAKHEMKGKLGATRTHLEQDLRGIAETEKGLQSRLASAQPTESAPANVPSLPDTDVSGGSSPNGSLPPDAGVCGSEGNSSDTEVKVLTSQLIEPGDLTEALICRICHDVVGCGPKLTRCSHLFCGDCLSQWFVAQPGNLTWAQRANSAGQVPCPVCKEKLHEQKDVFPVVEGGEKGSALLWGMLQRTRIRCANHKLCKSGGACDWIGDYGSYQTHISTCQNVECSEQPTQVAMTSAECDAKSDTSTCEMPYGRDRTNSSTAPSEDGLRVDALSTSDDNTVAGGLTPEEQDSPKMEPNPDPAEPEVSSLLSSIGALLDLKIKAKDREMAVTTTVTTKEAEMLEEPEMVLMEELPVLDDTQQKATNSRKEKKTAAATSTDQSAWQLNQQRHARIMAARANEIAQWQHLQAAQRSYAAQWQAAQWQAAYAEQWQTTYAAQAALAHRSRRS